MHVGNTQRQSQNTCRDTERETEEEMHSYGEEDPRLMICNGGRKMRGEKLRDSRSLKSPVSAVSMIKKLLMY